MYQRVFLRSKIHRATVTSTEMGYEGSLTVDSQLIRAAGLAPYEQIHVLNINNGNRFVTYVIEGAPGSGVIQVNGAAARLCQTGDLLIIISYAHTSVEHIAQHEPIVVHVNEHNQIIEELSK